MKNRTLLWAGGIIGLLVVLGIGYYLASPLFIDNTVDEAFPFELPDQAALAEMSDEDMKLLEAEFMTAVPDEAELAPLSDAEQAEVAGQVQEAAEVVMSDKMMDEAMPETAADWELITSGTFAGADSFHQGEGTAAVYRLGEMSVLRFEDFSVTNGPDLHVILSKHPNPGNRTDIGEDYIDLGSLKGNMGNQNYDLPPDVDITTYQSVVIYCLPFHVVFATATLNS